MPMVKTDKIITNNCRGEVSSPVLETNKFKQIENKGGATPPLQKDLPAGWVKSSMNNVCTIILGQSPPSSTYNANGEGLPFFQGKAEFGERYPTVIKYCSTPKKTAQKNDILISVRAPVGPTNIAPSKCCIGRGLAAIRPLEGAASLYIFYFLRSIEHELSEMGTGTTFKAISGSYLRSISIPLAPLDQQKLIVAEIEKQFSRLDESMAALKRIQANLKRYKASVLKAAVEGKLTEEWRRKNPDVEPASKLLKRILAERKKKWEEDYVKKYVAAHGHAPKDDSWKKKYKEPATLDTSNLPELPKGWVWAGLSQVALFQNGRSFPSKEYSLQGVKLLRPGNLYADGLVKWTHNNTKRLSEEWAAKYPDYLVGSGELIMNLTAQSLRDEFLGRTCITAEGERCLLNQRLARIFPLAGLNPHFLLWFLKAKIFRDFVDTLNTGSLIQHMFTSDLAQFNLPLPPQIEQEAIIQEIERCLSTAGELETAVETNLKRAERLRQSILKKAFSGKLLPQYQNDEQARELNL
jgi:type I restriction enzyme S subunit